MYPGQTVKGVSDSYRYFVVQVKDDATGCTAFVGTCFVNQADSFNFNLALQDHFKCLKETEA
jgi:hypothetical protein